jgi:hypothetical protein
LKVNLFSEEHIASIFRVKEYAQQETSTKEDGKQSKQKQYVCPKYWLTFNGLQRHIFQ